MVRVPLYVGTEIIFIAFFLAWRLLPAFFAETHFQFLLASIGFFCMSLSGVPRMVIRETLNRCGRRVTGAVALIDGIEIIVVCLALAAMSVIAWAIMTFHLFGWNG